MRYTASKISISLLVVTCMIGCTSIQPTYTSTGNPGYRVNCGGFFGDGDLGSCYQKAGEACQNEGYRIMQTGVSSMIFECRSSTGHSQLESTTPSKQ